MARMMTRFRVLTPLAGMALLAAVAACSSDDGDAAARGSGAAAAGGGMGGVAAGGGSGDGAAGGDSATGGDTATGGDGAGGSGAAPSGGAPAYGPDTLAGKFMGEFKVGAAVSTTDVSQDAAILTTHFNHLTAENVMKFSEIQPSEGTFTFDDADVIAQLARDNGMTMTGHAMVWHRQAPSWLFNDLTAGDAASIETLKARMKAHIEAMVLRYGDVVSNWDVVNEAISDDGGKTFRDGSEGSQWYDIFGDEEYIYWAFRYTYDALEAREPGSAAGKLFYNDYNVNLKVDRIVDLASWLRDDRGVPIDGIGLQAHWRLGWPSTADIQATIDKIVAAGFRVKISELDVSLYNDYPSGSFEPAPEVEFTDALEQQQAQRYAELFQLFRANAASIDSVTFWGISDGRSWLDNEPVSGRNDHPLLWDDDSQPKAALGAILAVE